MSMVGTLGIDLGTQGLSVVLVDDAMKVIAAGEATYEMVDALDDGCYEQRPADWEAALAAAMQQLRSKLGDSSQSNSLQVDSIGISGQMHGEVLIDAEGASVGTARLWCDSRNDTEGRELTHLLGVKIPKRMTVARWLWTCRHDSEKASRAIRMTTPAGWLAFRLTGEHLLGIGDASGMFPIDPATLDFDRGMMAKLESASAGVRWDGSMLPTVRVAGQDGGSLNETGAQILGLPVQTSVAPAEGDQPAALAGSLIAQPGLVSASFGTSVCANAVGDRSFHGVSRAIDHFCAVDGKPINMVFLRNGTTFMNAVVEMFSVNSRFDFAGLMQQALEAPADCGGILALPFMDEEPGLGITAAEQAGLFGFTGENATAGNSIKAALLATVFNLKSGLSELDSQGYPRTEIVLTGGLAKTPELGQVVADVLETPVTIPAAADEGTAYGAALLGKYRLRKIDGDGRRWEEFVQDHQQAASHRFQPDENSSFAYAELNNRYLDLMKRVTT